MASDEQGDIQVETEEVSAVSRAVSVTVPASKVDLAFQSTFKKLGKNARVKGFRPGKVPVSVIERVYGPSAAEEIEHQLVHETLRDAMELAGVDPISEPDIDASVPARGAAFTYVARVEVRPEIELPDLDGLPAQKPAIEVPEDEVQTQLEAMREHFAPMIELPEDAEAELGHTLNIDFEGSIDGVLFEGGAGKGMDLELGKGQLIPGFEEQLVGAKAGDDRTVSVTFPSDYGEASLRDKAAEFAVHVNSLRHKELPALDDEFAKDREADSLEDLRAKIRAELEKSRESEAQQALNRSLMDGLVERTEFPLPPGLVEGQIERQMEQLKRQFAGQVPEEILNQEMGRMREDGREQAERRVREMLIVDAIARANDIEATGDEIELKLDQLAMQQGVDPAMFRQAAAQQGWHGAIAAEIRDEKVLEFLSGKAKVSEAPSPEA